MDDDFLIATTSAASTPVFELDDGANALFVDYQILKVFGDAIVLTWWIEESNDGMVWKLTDTVNNDNPVSAGQTGNLLSSVLGGVMARATFSISAGGSITLRVSVNQLRR